MRTACITILSAIVLEIAVMSVPAQAQNEGMGVLGPIKKDEDAAKRERPRRATEEKLRQRSRPVAREKSQAAPVEASRPSGGGGGGKSQIGVGF